MAVLGGAGGPLHVNGRIWGGACAFPSVQTLSVRTTSPNCTKDSYRIPKQICAIFGKSTIPDTWNPQRRENPKNPYWSHSSRSTRDQSPNPLRSLPTCILEMPPPRCSNKMTSVDTSTEQLCMDLRVAPSDLNHSQFQYR